RASDAAQAGQAAGGGGRTDPGDERGCDRPGGGPGPVRGALPEAGGHGAAERDRDEHGRGAGGGGPGRVSGAGRAVVRARRPGDGERYRRGGAVRILTTVG